jgi:phosphoglycerate dehydrogenase-like enzyme
LRNQFGLPDRRLLYTSGPLTRTVSDAAAMLDVHEPEPFGNDYPLLNVPNAYLAPHLASRTMTAMDTMSGGVKDVAAVLAGRAPRHPAW